MKIEMTTVPAHHILSIRDTVPLDSIPTFLKPSYECIEALVSKAGIKEEACRAYTYSMSPDEIDIAAAYVIAEDDLDVIRAAVEEANNNDSNGAFGGLELIEFDERNAAMTVHHGSYNKLADSWSAFAQELATEGIKVSEPTFEDYVDRGDGSSTAEAVTNLYWYLSH